MDVPRFFADQTYALLTHPDNISFNRIILPQTILGINEDQQLVEARKEGILRKYDQLRCLMRMEFDPEINAFVLEKTRAAMMLRG